MKQQISNYLNRYAPFTPDEIDIFYEHLTLKTYAKKEFLQRANQVYKHQFFIVEGVLRSFYVDRKGDEQTLQFGIENWWITHMESFLKGTPSHLYLQSVETSKVLLISKENLEKLYLEIPSLERCFRIITENMLIAVQKHNEFHATLSSKERYDLLTQSFPDFAQRVPQYMIASYLKITPEHLSVLRKKKK